MPTKDELRIMQALDLETKIKKTKLRIREWVSYYGKDGVYVSFSGGKDSTVLLHIARQMYPDIEAVFVNTGLEYPEVQSFVKSFDNVTILRPKMRFDEVIKTYGYPFISKEVATKIYYLRKGSEWAKKKVFSNSKFSCERYAPLVNVDFSIAFQCCNVMKKKPLHEYAKKNGKVPITAQTAEESMLRTSQWLKDGCNAFNNKFPVSNPMSFWTEQDILQYIKQNNLPVASVYGDIVYGEKNSAQYDDLLCDCGSKLCTTGCNRTGCIFCGFGAHLDKGESRFQCLKRSHPRQYEYCMSGGAYDTDGLWKPTKDGLGMAHCIDELNKIYGKNFIRY